MKVWKKLSGHQHKRLRTWKIRKVEGKELRKQEGMRKKTAEKKKGLGERTEKTMHLGNKKTRKNKE